MFAIWLGELISGIRHPQPGPVADHLAGIVAGVPANLARMMADQSSRWFVVPFIVVMMFLIIFAIVFVQQGRRNVPVMYPGRRMGNRMSMPVKGTLPLMVNMAA